MNRSIWTVLPWVFAGWLAGNAIVFAANVDTVAAWWSALLSAVAVIVMEVWRALARRRRQAETSKEMAEFVIMFPPAKEPPIKYIVKMIPDPEFLLPGEPADTKEAKP